MVPDFRRLTQDGLFADTIYLRHSRFKGGIYYEKKACVYINFLLAAYFFIMFMLCRFFS